jgi:hypothetical protein
VRRGANYGVSVVADFVDGLPAEVPASTPESEQF